MASYRYERDIDPKDLKPRKQRQYSRRERWANWWDYNLKWVLIFGIAGAFVAYCFIGQYFRNRICHGEHDGIFSHGGNHFFCYDSGSRNAYKYVCTLECVGK